MVYLLDTYCWVNDERIFARNSADADKPRDAFTVMGN